MLRNMCICSSHHLLSKLAAQKICSKDNEKGIRGMISYEKYLVNEEAKPRKILPEGVWME